MENIQIIEVVSEIGAGTRGASLGPDAIRTAALKHGSKLYHEQPAMRVEDQNQLLWEPITTPNALRITGIVEVYKAISKRVASELTAGKFPLVIAADHASAGGTIAGIKAAFPDQRLGVIWIDAHADLHSPYTTPSGNVHGMPLATALNEDNLPCRENTPNAEAIAGWNALKQTGGVAPKVQPGDIVFIGVRDTEAPEDALRERMQLPNITVEEVQTAGAQAAAQKALAHLVHCDLIYISYDVDSLDSSISKGTGTPVAGGLSVAEAKTIITTLLADTKVRCFELVEVNPCLDDKINTMAEKALEVLEVVTNTLQNR